AVPLVGCDLPGQDHDEVALPLALPDEDVAASGTARPAALAQQGDLFLGQPGKGAIPVGRLDEAVHPGSLHAGLVDVAPTPGLAGLVRPDDRVADRPGVPPRVLQRRRVAAAD